MSSPLIPQNGTRDQSCIEAALVESRRLSQEGEFKQALQVIEATVTRETTDGGTFDNSDKEPTKLSCLFQYGICLGNLEKHDDALKVASVIQQRFPRHAEGYYLEAMALSSKKKLDEARIALAKGLEADSAIRGIERAQASHKKLLESLREFEFDRLRRSVRKHAEAVTAIVPVACPRCGAGFSLPTPQWLCPKCFQAGSSQLLWESDGNGACHVCKKDLSAGSRHHCRSCGRLVCSGCSPETASVSILEFNEQVRVCHQCVSLLKAFKDPDGRQSPRANVREPEPGQPPVKRPSAYSGHDAMSGGIQ